MALNYIPGRHARTVDGAGEVKTSSEAVCEDIDHRFTHDLDHIFSVLSELQNDMTLKTFFIVLIMQLNNFKRLKRI